MNSYFEIVVRIKLPSSLCIVIECRAKHIEQVLASLQDILHIDDLYVFNIFCPQPSSILLLHDKRYFMQRWEGGKAE